MVHSSQTLSRSGVRVEDASLETRARAKIRLPVQRHQKPIECYADVTHGKKMFVAKFESIVSPNIDK